MRVAERWHVRMYAWVFEIVGGWGRVGENMYDNVKWFLFVADISGYVVVSVDGNEVENR